MNDCDWYLSSIPVGDVLAGLYLLQIVKATGDAFIARADGGQWSQRSEDDAERIECPLGGILEHLHFPKQGFIMFRVYE